MYPFERFNEDAKRTLTLAQEEAERSHHSYIGTEHLLLALLRVESGTAFRVLTNLGIAIKPVREAISKVLGRNERITIQQIIPTSRVKLVIEMSFGEAQRMGHDHVDTGHMLIALLLEGEGIAAQVLEDLGATLERVVAAVEVALEVPATPGKKRRRRPLVRLAEQAQLDQAARPIDIIPTTSSADLLHGLLRTPVIARLLRAKGVDTQALLKQLGELPPPMADLRSRLANAQRDLSQAVTRWEYERAAILRDEVADLSEMLGKAEEDWLDSLA